MAKKKRDIRRKIMAIEHALSTGNMSQSCRCFGIYRGTFYCWRRPYRNEGAMTEKRTWSTAVRTPQPVLATSLET